MKTYAIKLVGCDDHTMLKIELSEKQALFLTQIAEMLNAQSDYRCKPVMRVDEWSEEDEEEERQRNEWRNEL